MNEKELRNQIIEYGKSLVKNHLIQATWGNISCRIDDEYFLITPSGVDYFVLKPEDIVKVKIDDYSYKGNIKPSSEKVLHGMIYKNKKDVGGIVHVHSSYLQIFASCHKDLINEKTIYKCSEYAVSGSKKLANNVYEALENNNGVIMANHGFVGIGKDIELAFNECIKAEELAKEMVKQKC